MQLMLASLLTLFLLAVFLDSFSNAAVYRFTPQGGSIRGDPLTGPTKFELDAPLVAKVESSEEKSEKSEGVKGSMNGDEYFTVTVGTPPQNLTVQLDFWSYSYFHIYGADAGKQRNSKRKWYGYDNYERAVRSYNGSASSTFVNTTSNFTGYYCHGQFEQDVVNLSGAVLKNATMAVLHSYTYHGYAKWINRYIYMDGLVGLHPQPSFWKNTFVESIASQLDKPVVSYHIKYEDVYKNNTYEYTDETPTITLGAEDSVNCNSDWVYADRQSNYTTNYNVDFSSISASLANGSSFDGSSFKINATFGVAKGYSTYASGKIFQLIVNATNAKYNTTISKYGPKYVVDCDQLENGGSVIVNIGKDAQTEKKVVLKGTDIITKYNGACILAVENYDRHLIKGYEVLHVGNGFLSNHCLSKNIVTKEYGFASTKIRSNRPRGY